MRKLGLILFLSLFAASVQAEDYQQLAKTDLESIQTELLVNAAQVLDSKDVSFHAWVIRGYKLASARLARVDSPAGYYYLLRYYVNGFRDPHIQFNAPNLDLTSQWPGFSLGYSSGIGFVVTGSTLSEIPDGAELIECDSQSPKQLMLQRVFPYFGNPGLSASWVINTPRLMIDQGNPWTPSLKNCEFQIQGKTIPIDLIWRPISDAEVVNLLNAGKAQTTLGTMSFAKTGIWVYLPGFLHSTTLQIQALQHLLEDLGNQDSAGPVVLDLRGNNSKGSIYVQQLLLNVFGTVLPQNSAGINEQHWWRVSAANLVYIEEMALPVAARVDGVDSARYQMFYQNMLNMKQALAEHQLYYTEIELKTALTDVRPMPANLSSRKVFVLVDSYCISACLDLVDAIKAFPNVILIGQRTNADTVYRKTENATLPSGNLLMLPMSIIKNGVRKNHQYYQPCYTYPGNIVDTAAVQSWLSNAWQSMQACTITPAGP